MKIDRVKPVTQSTIEFVDTILWDIDKIAEIKQRIGVNVKTKRGEIKKPWLQNMVEQIILFYKVVIFHQDCVRMVLTLINDIAMADNSRIDNIIEVLGPKAKDQIKGIDV